MDATFTTDRVETWARAARKTIDERLASVPEAAADFWHAIAKVYGASVEQGVEAAERLRTPHKVAQ
jgi:hypothetical protein